MYILKLLYKDLCSKDQNHNESDKKEITLIRLLSKPECKNTEKIPTIVKNVNSKYIFPKLYSATWSKSTNVSTETKPVKRH